MLILNIPWFYPDNPVNPVKKFIELPESCFGQMTENANSNLKNSKSFREAVWKRLNLKLKIMNS